MMARTPVALSLALIVAGCGRDDPGKARRDRGPVSPASVAAWWGDEDDDVAGEHFAARDMDGDGRAEILIGVTSGLVHGPMPENAHSHGGAYAVDHTTPTGTMNDVCQTCFLGRTNGDFFGSQLELLGDFTGDGQPDTLIRGIFENDPTIQWGLYSGWPTGEISYRDVQAWFEEERRTPIELGGWSAACGDLDGDGTEELCFGNSRSETATDENPDVMAESVIFFGAARSGALGTEGDVLLRAPASEYAGQSSQGGRDVNGDGLSDWVVGATWRDAHTGGVYLVSDPPRGTHPLADYPFWEGTPDSATGGALSVGGDVDGDGLEDVAVGATFFDDRRGRAYVLTDKDGGRVEDAFATFSADRDLAWVGASTALADFDDDGQADVAVGVPGDVYFNVIDPGRVAIYLGPVDPGVHTVDQADVLLSTGNEGPDSFGSRMEAADVDGDGADDLVVAAPYESVPGECVRCGVVRLWLAPGR